MRYRRLDLNLLIALEALLTERSVTRAAAKLYMTQPAMSGALSRLRENLNDQLLVQVGRHLELTPRAEALLDPVRDIILRIDSALTTEPDFKPEKSKRHFVIVASDYVIRTFLLDTLKKVHQEAPGMSFEFHQPGNSSYSALEAGEVDFVIGPEIDTLEKHPNSNLFQDTYTVIAWSENTLMGDTLSFDGFMALGHVIFRSSDNGMPWFDRWFTRQYNDARRIDFSVHSFDLLPYMVVGTDLIATMPANMAKRYAEDMPLKLYTPPMELPVLTEVLQWNSYRDEDPANKWFRELLQSAATKLPPLKIKQ